MTTKKEMCVKCWTFVVVVLLLLSILSIGKISKIYQDYGIGALIDLQHQKYQQEQAVTDSNVSYTSPLIRCNNEKYNLTEKADCIADLEMKR